MDDRLFDEGFSYKLQAGCWMIESAHVVTSFLISGRQRIELPRRDDPGHPDGPGEADGASQHRAGHHAAVQDRPHQTRVQGPELLSIPGYILLNGK